MSGFPVENIIAVGSTSTKRGVPKLIFALKDCMELLLPMAAKKLDMSFNIEPEVPLCMINHEDIEA